MRDNREAPGQLPLEFESAFGDIKLESQSPLRSNVVTVNFTQPRAEKDSAVDREETRTILQHVLSSARKLHW